MKISKTVSVIILAIAIPILPITGVNAEEGLRMTLEEVVVTARKREESLQEVPDSITAFSAEQISERRLARINDAILLTPNVHIVDDQDAGTNIITVRGIGTNRNLAASVAYVVDGVILPDSDAFTSDLSDVERIEILKGPQGALYGKNAIGGVINITTKRPGNDTEGELKLGYGNGDTKDIFAALSGALIKDQLYARATVNYRDTDGLIDNQFDGSDMDFDESVKVGGRLIWEPTSNLSFDLRGSYFDQDVGSLWFSTFDVLGTTGGRLTEAMARVEPNQDDEHFSDRRIYDVSLTAELDTEFGSFTSITAYDDIKVFFNEDLDASPLPITNDAQQLRKVRGISQEIRFTSSADKRLRYIIGAYYQNTQRDVMTTVELDFCFFLALPFCATPPGVVSGGLVPQNLNTTEGDFDQWAVFAQANYDITEQLELTFALRYDEDKRKQLDLLSNRNDSAKFSDLQPKVSLAWRPNENLMLYGTYAEGYKSGAFNPPPGPGASFPLIVEQESTDSYEVGIKSTWYDQRLLMNASFFYTEYTDAQIFQLDLTTGGQVAINADAAEIKGVELEMIALPMEGVELNLGYGFTDGEFTDFNGSGLHDGNWLPNSPRYQLNAGVRYQRPVFENLEWVSRLDFHQTGRIYYAEDNLLYQPSYHTVDAQMSIEGENWTLTAWGENILNQEYVTSAFSRLISPLIYGTLGVDPIQIDGGPRYGVELRWRF